MLFYCPWDIIPSSPWDRSFVSSSETWWQGAHDACQKDQKALIDKRTLMPERQPAASTESPASLNTACPFCRAVIHLHNIPAMRRSKLSARASLFYDTNRQKLLWIIWISYGGKFLSGVDSKRTVQWAHEALLFTPLVQSWDLSNENKNRICNLGERQFHNDS